MANLFMRFPGWKTKAFTMSYDDGVRQDAHLMDIMNRRGLKGTFNISSGLFAPEDPKNLDSRIFGRRMTQREALELYGNSEHEVAVHGLTHSFLEHLPSNRAAYEIVEGRRRLENLFGYTVRGMAYPFGAFNDETVQILQKAGILYARTVDCTEKFDIPQDWLRLMPTCHHGHPQLMDLCDEFIGRKVIHAPQLFYLWGHSYEFDDDGNWSVIERFAEKISDRQDIWYATNISVFDYITAYRQLRFSVDMSMVENPTHTDLYFSGSDKNYMVKSGKTLFMGDLI